jgi:hypothetical protein
VARQVLKYGFAAIIPAVLVAAPYLVFHCSERFGCMGGHATTTTTWLFALVLGPAAVGMVGMAVADMVINGRYVLANRAEAKRRRRAAQTLHKTDTGTEPQS